MEVKMLHLRRIEREGDVYFVQLRVDDVEFEHALTPTDTNGISPQVRTLVNYVLETSPAMIQERTV